MSEEHTLTEAEIASERGLLKASNLQEKVNLVIKTMKALADAGICADVEISEGKIKIFPRGLTASDLRDWERRRALPSYKEELATAKASLKGSW
jgi:hypothetical protein